MKIKLLIGFVFLSVIAYSQEQSKTEKYPRGLLPSSTEKNIKYLYSEGYEKNAKVLPIVIDLSKSKYFPPIGRQYNGTCTPFSLVYYTWTFYRAKKLGIDFGNYKWGYNEVTKRYEPPIEIQKNLMNPYFVYNLCNSGFDKGSSAFWIGNSVFHIGTPTWDIVDSNKMLDSTYWPKDPKIWEKASYNKGLSVQFLNKEMGYDFLFIKERIADSMLFSVPIKMPDELINQTITSDLLPTFNNSRDFELWTNHMVTIVGYDDTIAYKEDGIVKHGAFKAVNSWGSDWGPMKNGCFYISYETIKDKIWYLCFAYPTPFIKPKVISTIKYNHDYKYKLNIKALSTTKVNGLSENTKVEFNPSGIYINSNVVRFEGGISFGLRREIDFPEFNQPTNVVISVNDVGSNMQGIVDSVYVEFDKDIYNLKKNRFYCEDYHTQIISNQYKEFKVSTLNLNEADFTNILRNNAAITFDYNTPWNEFPVIVEISLDNIKWEKLNGELKDNQKSLLIDKDRSSPNVKLRMSFKDFSDVNYIVKKSINYDSPDKINIVNNINSENLVVAKDIPKISWNTNLSVPLNIILRTQDRIIDTLATNVLSNQYTWQINSAISDTSKCFLQISDIHNNHFAFTNKFYLKSQVTFDEEILLSQYLIGDTIKSKFNIENQSVYPLRTEILSGNNCLKIMDFKEGNQISWIVPDTIKSFENCELILRDNRDNILAKNSTKFSLIPVRLNFKKSGIVGYNEAYFGIPAIKGPQIFLSHNSIINLNNKGEIVWSDKLNNCTSYSSVVIQDSLIYATVNQLDGNNLHIYNINGERKYIKSVSNSFLFNQSNVSIRGDKRLIAYSAAEEQVVCMNKNGEVLWSFDPAKVEPKVTSIDFSYISQNCVDIFDNSYFTVSDYLFKVDPNGKLLWYKRLNEDFDGVGGTLIIGIDQCPILASYQGLAKYDKEGKLLWYLNNVSTAFQPVITKEGNIIISCINSSILNQFDNIRSKLICIDPYGKLIWSYGIDDGCLTSAPLLGEAGNIYVLSSTDNTYLLSLTSKGEKRFQIKIGNSAKIIYNNSSSWRGGGLAFNEGGAIIVSTVEGKVFSFSTGEKELAKTAWPKELFNGQNHNSQNKYLSIEIDSLKTHFEYGGQLVLNVKKSDNISDYAVAFRSYDTKGDWKPIFEGNKNAEQFNWKFGNDIGNIKNIELKVYDNQNIGYCAFNEFPLNIGVDKIPVANSGVDQSINEGSTVTLDGSSSSNSEGNPLTYKWTAPAGISLSSISVAKPTFTAPEVSQDTQFTFSLIVYDGTASSTEDQVVITVKNVNKAPIANAGVDQTVNEGTTVSLDGTLSNDPDGNPLTYNWMAPVGITLSSASVQKPTFTAPEVTKDTQFTFSLVVSDGTASSTEDQVVITIRNVNKAPVANSGIDQTVNEGTTVILDGSLSSDPDGNSLTYKWTAPVGIILSNLTAPKPTFTAPETTKDTQYTFTLVVNDGTVDSPADQVVITVKNVNKAPIANAGADQTVNEGTTVSLDGTLSNDPDNDQLTYSWTAPEKVKLSDTKISKPTFIAPEVKKDSTILFSLIVSDGVLSSTTSTVKVNIVNVIKVGFPEIFTKSLKVYPNPITNELIIEDLGNHNKTEFEIINSAGQAVYTGILVEKEIVKTSHFSPGVYIVRFKSGGSFEFKKVIKK